MSQLPLFSFSDLTAFEDTSTLLELRVERVKNVEKQIQEASQTLDLIKDFVELDEVETTLREQIEVSRQRKHRLLTATVLEKTLATALKNVSISEIQQIDLQDIQNIIAESFDLDKNLNLVPDLQETKPVDWSLEAVQIFHPSPTEKFHVTHAEELLIVRKIDFRTFISRGLSVQLTLIQQPPPIFKKELPFNFGAERFAILCASTQPLFSAEAISVLKFVLKTPLRRITGILPTASRQHCQIYVACMLAAKDFNEQVKAKLGTGESFLPIEFLPVYQIQLLDHQLRLYGTIEPFVEAFDSFKKWNTNGAGFVDESAEEIQAFSHFSWHASGFTHMIVDMQGVKTLLSYVCFDPAIHSPSGDLGVTDRSSDGIKDFNKNHKCNRFCKLLGLTPD